MQTRKYIVPHGFRDLMFYIELMQEFSILLHMISFAGKFEHENFNPSAYFKSVCKKSSNVGASPALDSRCKPCLTVRLRDGMILSIVPYDVSI